MESLSRPSPLDVEETMNKFIQYLGGSLITDILKDISGLNADYYFDNHDIVAELKCLKKDLFSNEDDKDRLPQLVEVWFKKNLLKEDDLPDILFGKKSLPNECIDELIKAAAKTIERAIHKAIKQIKHTRILLSKPNSKGLIFLVNDGNYFLSHSHFIGLTASIISRKFSKEPFDAFIYLTINQVAAFSENDLDRQIWVPCYITDDTDKLGDFIDESGNKFFQEFMPSVTGIYPTEHIKIKDFEEGMKTLEKLKHIPKDIAFPKKK